MDNMDNMDNIDNIENKDNLLLGANINISNGFDTAPWYSNSMGGNFFQIFLRNPQSYNPNPRTKQSLIKFKDNLEKYDCKCVVHSSFIVNLARNPTDYQHYKGVDVVVEDLDHSVVIGAIGAIIHMGKNVKDMGISDDAAINNYVDGIESILRKSNKKSTLILETGAGCGTEICTDIKKLGELRKKVKSKYRHRVKFCIDTCHIFSAGYPINNINYIDDIEQIIDEELGWNNVVVIHLNDSKKECNTCTDFHADIGKGFIGTEALIKFVKMCADKNIPIVLETPCDTYKGERFTHEDQIKLIKNRLENKVDKAKLENKADKSKLENKADKSKLENKADSKVKLENKVDSKAKLENKVDKAKLENKVDKAKLENKADSKAKLENKAESKAKSENKTESKAKLENKADSKAKLENNADSKAKLENKAESKAKSENKTESKAKSENKTESKAKLENKADSKAKSENKTESKAKSENKTESKNTTKNKSKIKNQERKQ
jgi:deoxyribonuclease-4